MHFCNGQKIRKKRLYLPGHKLVRRFWLRIMCPIYIKFTIHHVSGA